MLILDGIRRALALIVSSVMMLFAGGGNTESYTVLDEENCRLCITVFSDTHIESNNSNRYKIYKRMLDNAAANSYGSDLMIFLGDNTMNGQDIESLIFYGTAAQTKVSDNVITVCGNHDVGNGEGDYDKLFSRFTDYNRALLGVEIDKPYYYKVINGYYFIVLGPEDLCVYECPVSEEQYEFLEDTMALASESGKPIFVCCHWPYDDIDEDWGERAYSIMSQYDDVFFISGHTHMPFIEGWSMGTWYGINEINMPRCTELAGKNDDEIYEDSGDAAIIEVYDNEVVARGRNFYTGEWLEEMEYHYAIG